MEEMTTWPSPSQGGAVSAMTINRRVILGFVPSGDKKVHLCSAQFKGEVRFNIDEITEPSCVNGASKKVNYNGTWPPKEEYNWGSHAREPITLCRIEDNNFLRAIGKDKDEPILSNDCYDAHKGRLEPKLAKRAENYFSENTRVEKGFEAWASGMLDELGKLISASGRSSFLFCRLERTNLFLFGKENVANIRTSINLFVSKLSDADNLLDFSGTEPLIQLYRILLRASGVIGARFGGARFRECCLAHAYADKAKEAASYVWLEYSKCQPALSSYLKPDTAVMICEAAGDGGLSHLTTPGLWLTDSLNSIGPRGYSLKGNNEGEC